MTLSFINYAILVDFHLANPKLAQDTHILVLWSALASAAFMGVQILFPNSILLSLGRGFTMILQGAWWHIIGHILFDGMCIYLTYTNYIYLLIFYLLIYLLVYIW